MLVTAPPGHLYNLMSMTESKPRPNTLSAFLGMMLLIVSVQGCAYNKIDRAGLDRDIAELKDKTDFICGNP